jgi:hypothetical protein
MLVKNLAEVAEQPTLLLLHRLVKFTGAPP